MVVDFLAVAWILWAKMVEQMRIKELIEKLKEFDSESEVYVFDDANRDYSSIQHVAFGIDNNKEYIVLYLEQ